MPQFAPPSSDMSRSFRSATSLPVLNIQLVFVRWMYNIVDDRSEVASARRARP